jgi:hypothetical protein
MVQIADHVFVLEGGRSAEEGTPLVLREAGGGFSRFVRTTHSDEATSSSTTAARPNLAEEKPDGGIQKHIDALIDDRPC